LQFNPCHMEGEGYLAARVARQHTMNKNGKEGIRELEKRIGPEIPELRLKVVPGDGKAPKGQWGRGEEEKRSKLSRVLLPTTKQKTMNSAMSGKRDFCRKDNLSEKKKKKRKGGKEMKNHRQKELGL